ncbi:315403be-c6a5-49dd-b71d-d5c69440cf92 [Thermothielavioides terrestris]|uniref:315403be-c6a5-49dd-b71d-d5c69440cf92 n=1 Tax=Thermothielavioides terrestris TaxID=2587410 RepID=A0A3S4BPT9_9PEZI|nr:315403be-c6a5-49dd-b71d-d5c69440cf92 [Thermothielavioides terrestris]
MSCDGPGTTALATPTTVLDTALITSQSSSRYASSTSSFPSPTGEALFNEGQLPLEPQITPGWAVAGTILLGTGIVHALCGIRAKRVHTFFSTAFLASLGTTVLILYLMTPPVSSAVQGAFVVAAVCTGAALGGLAVLFIDLAECLGCLLGGFSFSMWLLTLRPGALVPSASGKVVFIAAFSLAGFCLYFSRWTRTYGLMACTSFSGATATVLGIDCFGRAGLKEFWAYIWALNDKLFPEGAVTYPLTRGIRVELAVTVLLFIVGIVSQLKLWRLIRDRRNKSGEDSSDEERALPDEEENIGRQVEEVTSRERREWERVYGDGGSAPDVSHTEVDDSDSVQHEDHSKRTSATSSTEIQSPADLPPDGEVPAEPSEKKPAEQAIMANDADDGRVMVRVVHDDVPEKDAADRTAEREQGGDGPVEPSVDSTARRSPHNVPGPQVIPLPFKIPVSGDERGRGRSSVAGSVDLGDGSSVAAVADEEEGAEERAPSVQAQEPDLEAENPARAVRGQESFRNGLVQQSAGNGLEEDQAGDRRASPIQPAKVLRVDSDSIVATLDDESDHGDADTAVLDSSPRLPEGEEDKNEADADGRNVPLHKKGDGSSKDTASAESLRTVVARLTRQNLPPALPEVALMYRTNEWAKHLSIAEVPELDTLQSPEPIPDTAVEDPAHLDVVGLQQTAENGAPAPAAPRASSAMSSYAHNAASRSTLRTSLSGSEIGLDTQSGQKPGQPTGTAHHRHSASISTPNLVSDGPVPGANASSRLPTLIGMREMLLRSRASGSFSAFNNDAVNMPTDPSITRRPPSDAGSVRNYPMPSADAHLDDVPLSQRRAMMRQSSLSLAGGPPPAPALPVPTADSIAFDSHQPARHRNVPTEAVRQAKLANFRNSVAADLRTTPLVPNPSTAKRLSSRMLGLMTPAARASASASMPSLHTTTPAATTPTPARAFATPTPGIAPAAATAAAGAAERANSRGDALRSIELQRSILLGQKEAEAARRRAALAERERFQREFEERMRSGALMGAHRDAMRRLQGAVKG